MARSAPKPQQAQQAESQIPGGSSGAPFVEHDSATIPLAPPDLVRAAREEREPDEPVVPVARYRVLQERRIMHRGSLTMLKPGKIVDESNYRIEDLIGQGVQLQKLEE
jgi:hypothetical protein